MKTSNLISSIDFYNHSDKVHSVRIDKAYRKGFIIADAVDAGQSPQERAATCYSVKVRTGQKLPAQVAAIAAGETADVARRMLAHWAFDMAKVIRETAKDSKSASSESYNMIRACNTFAESKGWKYKLTGKAGKSLEMPTWDKVENDTIHAGTTDIVADAETANKEKAERKAQAETAKAVQSAIKAERGAIEKEVSARLAEISGQLDAERVAHAATAADCARVYLSLVAMAKGAGMDIKMMAKACKLAEKRAAFTAKAIGQTYTGETLASTAAKAKAKAKARKAAKK